MKNIMIDLESIDTETTAGVLSIGAVMFDLEDNKIGDMICINIGYENALESGTSSPDTIKFWHDQPLNLRNEQFYPENPLTMYDALLSLNNFIKDNVNEGEGFKVWAKGPNFDISILENHYKLCDIKVPWHFASIRDVRTLMDIGDVNRDDVDFCGIAHDPVHDCIHQVKLCSLAYRKIKHG